MTKIIRTNNLLAIIILIIAFFDYILYQKFLVIHNSIFFKILVMSLFISFIIYKKSKNKNYIEYFLLTSLVGYLVIFGYIYLIHKKLNYEKINVPIYGYYTKRIDGVIFKYQEKNFDRPVNKIKDEIINNNPIKNFYLTLGLFKYSNDIYYLDTIEFKEK